MNGPGVTPGLSFLMLPLDYFHKFPNVAVNVVTSSKKEALLSNLYQTLETKRIFRKNGSLWIQPCPITW
jgi:hypothetical protein